MIPGNLFGFQMIWFLSNNLDISLEEDRKFEKLSYGVHLDRLEIQNKFWWQSDLFSDE